MSPSPGILKLAWQRQLQKEAEPLGTKFGTRQGYTLAYYKAKHNQICET